MQRQRYAGSLRPQRTLVAVNMMPRAPVSSDSLAEDVRRDSGLLPAQWDEFLVRHSSCSPAHERS